MDASTRFETRVVGALPLVGAMMQQWGLAEIVNRVVPWEGEIPLGTLVEVLVTSRLLNPQAMYIVGEWAKESGVTDYFGVTAEQLNDDRLGRALERIADHRDAVQAALTLAAVKQWKVKVDQIHYDISTVELYGAYANAQPTSTDPGTGPSLPTMPTVPFPTYGRTKSGRDDVKQVQFGLSVLGDGAIPAGLIPLAGNTPEARTHVASLRQLAKIFPKRKFLYMGDSKLDTPENLVTAHMTGGLFLCAAAFSQTLQARFREARSQLKPIDYCSLADSKRPPEKRDQYQACEVKDQVVSTFNGQKVTVKHRLLFVHSSAKAERQAATRQRHLDKIEAELQQVQKLAGKYSLKTEDKIRRRLEVMLGKYSEGKLYDYTVSQRGPKFTVTWSINAARLEQVKELEGVFVLRTNESRKLSPAGVLGKYREQICVEKRIHHTKGPLAVAPVFLKNPKRIAGLLCIIVWALTILSLMERQVRTNLKGQPLVGLLPENRPSPNPTGPKLLKAFATLSVVTIHDRGETTHRLTQLTATQRKILKLLDAPDGALQTFKRRCGM